VKTEGESLVRVCDRRGRRERRRAAQAAALQERLQKALEPLPFKTRISQQ
jgi:fatty-acyl-CoA synthase